MAQLLAYQRCEVARDMLAQEPKEVRERLDAEHRTAHELAVAEREKEEEEGTLPSCDEEIQAKCREEFLPIVAPLLMGLRAYTGYTINIVAGRVNRGLFDVVSANAGTVDGKDWAKWDPVGYGEMLPRFLKFVHAASSGDADNVPTPDALDIPTPTDEGAAPEAPRPSGLADSVIGSEMIQLPDPNHDNKEDGGLPPLVEDEVDRMLLAPPPPPPRAPVGPALLPAPPSRLLLAFLSAPCSRLLLLPAILSFLLRLPLLLLRCEVSERATHRSSPHGPCEPSARVTGRARTHATDLR
ncbi:hypothetical protein B0H14DRAFT_3502526 [Mycena olivaceomarginata]|nr:hypothetical protein B0H14DRAFT_3502526 [Mycena olivaceomarginata]